MYTRDTPDFLVLSFEAQGLLELIMRKLDRAGVLHLGKQGPRGVAIAIGHPHRWETISPALDELLLDGCLVVAGSALVMPNFLEAQTALQSDRMRQQVHRERRRDLARAHEAGLPVTLRDVESQGVTECHTRSRGVTFGHSDPSLTVPSGIGAALASPCDLPAIASSSQLPPPETPPTADVAYGSNGVGGRLTGAVEVSKPATGKPRAPRVKRQVDLLPPEAVELAAYLLEAIRTHKPNVKDGSKGWARDLDLAMRVDLRSPAAIRAVIDFAHRSRETFWRPNLLSGAKVREHFDTLEIQMARAPALPADGAGWRQVAAEARRRGV